MSLAWTQAISSLVRGLRQIQRPTPASGKAVGAGAAGPGPSVRAKGQSEAGPAFLHHSRGGSVYARGLHCHTCVQGTLCVVPLGLCSSVTLAQSLVPPET